MRKLYMSAFSICTLFGLSAQEILWQKDIKSSTQDFLSQVTTTIDQQYLITGSSIQSTKLQVEGGRQNNGYDFHVVKLNQEGQVVFNRYFSGNAHDHLISTIPTKEGGFLLSGTSYSGKGLDKKESSRGGSDIWIIRINEFGDELWQKTLGTSADEESSAVIQTTDEGFFVVGNIQNTSIGYGSKDIVIYKLDKDGNEISRLILGGKGSDEAKKMLPTRDGGSLVGVYSRSTKGGSKKTGNNGDGDFWLIKLSKDNNVEWEKNYGTQADDQLKTLALTTTGFLVAGETQVKEGTDLWILSLNEKGDEIWNKTYTMGGRDVLMGTNIVHSGDDKTTNGILLGGYTQADGKIEENDESFWLLYLDQNGNESWRKHVKGESHQREERLSDVKLNRDGSIILAGTSSPQLGSENWKIVKLGDKQITELIPKYDIKVYPNPVSDYTYIEIGYDFKEADIILYDMGGRQLYNLKTKNKVTKINTQTLVQGAYLVSIKTDTDKTASAKLIKK
ncbi:T9SS type A sorting domain-containing protein [Chryseobacterium sp. L7]|uniref:T9SS type A sorting domain-containing protein n=1 Tax=Chryseobacterium endalhagicum TaxID=2797638 RepID=A0ABS1QN08_9FLAO|nr:T9SS type A sorting domain-containing protein [Chryseobacterium endalhagicum]MBL1223273.1 T9SS type A sorting domain-containing protein [Chryseobacterium endalhagicum]